MGISMLKKNLHFGTLIHVLSWVEGLEVRRVHAEKMLQLHGIVKVNLFSHNLSFLHWSPDLKMRCGIFLETKEIRGTIPFF